MPLFLFRILTQAIAETSKKSLFPAHTRADHPAPGMIPSRMKTPRPAAKRQTEQAASPGPPAPPELTAIKKGRGFYLVPIRRPHKVRTPRPRSEKKRTSCINIDTRTGPNTRPAGATDEKSLACIFCLVTVSDRIRYENSGNGQTRKDIGKTD